MAHTQEQNQKNSSEPVAPYDWFIPAIETEGTVTECLSSVLDDLALRSDFIYALKNSISGSDATGADEITKLGRKLKALDNTLRFRLGILRPERPGAWFKKPIASTTGPFASALLKEPVFQPYDPSAVSNVSKSLIKCWKNSSLTDFPFDDEPCLWRSLIEAKITLARITILPEPFENLRLDMLPSDLPPKLSTPSLRAFLTNVQAETKRLKSKIDDCYSQLFKSSQKLWTYQRELDVKTKEGWQTGKKNIHSQRAEKTRAHFSQRRQSATTSPLRTAADLQALRYLGFEKYPSVDALRQRYLIMAKRLHPDRLGGNEDAFKMLTKSYKHISAQLRVTT